MSLMDGQWSFRAARLRKRMKQMERSDWWSFWQTAAMGGCVALLSRCCLAELQALAAAKIQQIRLFVGLLTGLNSNWNSSCPHRQQCRKISI
jgi:hypothetical protein